MADDLFADIWGDDDDNMNATSTQAPVAAPTSPDDDLSDEPGPSRRPHKPLFHGSDEDEDNTTRSRPGKALPPELDALFPPDDEEDEDFSLNLNLPKTSLDLQQLAKEAEARHSRNIRAEEAKSKSSSSKAPAAGAGTRSKDPLELARQFAEEDEAAGRSAPAKTGKKKAAGETQRKPLPKLDETRLLGPQGFKALIPLAKKFKPKGKGHEAEDLSKVLEMYQLWTHRMYPKTQFRDTIEKVEKLCHSRRMMTSLSVWRDELKNGPSVNGGITEDDAINVDGSDEDEEEAHTRQFDASGRPEPIKAGSLASNPTAGASSSTAPQRQQIEIDDADMDALMAEMEATQRSAAKQNSNSLDDGIDDDEWAVADEMDRASRPIVTKSPTTAKKASEMNVQQDADMWGDDDFGDLEEFMTEDQPPPSSSSKALPATGRRSSSPTAGQATDPEDGTTAVSTSASTMDLDADDSIPNDPEALRRRRESIREEFDAGWDDMYE